LATTAGITPVAPSPVVYPAALLALTTGGLVTLFGFFAGVIDEFPLVDRFLLVVDLNAPHFIL
jgi:hypothetical protein